MRGLCWTEASQQWAVLSCGRASGQGIPMKTAHRNHLKTCMDFVLIRQDLTTSQAELELMISLPRSPESEDHVSELLCQP